MSPFGENLRPYSMSLSASKVVIVVPTLDRVKILDRLVDSIRATSNPDECRVVFVVDTADRASAEKISELGCDFILKDGKLPVKVNAGVRATTEPLVVFANDDVVFHEGWLEAALPATERVSVVGLNDLSPLSAQRATQMLVRREYIEDPGAAWREKGTLLHEGYHHNYVDDELVGLAKARDEYLYVPTSIVEHLHPSWGKAEIDSTYERGAFQHSDDDKALFESRRRDWLHRLSSRKPRPPQRKENP